MTRRIALLLNFTAPVYHWGCYGTSTELYLTLQERGYLVNWLDLRTTQSLEAAPRGVEDFASPTFATTFLKANKAVYHALTEADVIVVNGEGTLHRCSSAALNLLYLMHLAQRGLRKPVHLINHSLYPSGTEAPNAVADELYRRVVTGLTQIVPRETASAAILTRLGVASTQGFDCLPRFIARHGMSGRSDPSGPLVVTGGVNQSEPASRLIAEAIGAAIPTGSRRLIFLSGAKSLNAREDKTAHEVMRAVLPALEWLEAGSIETWLGAIAEASGLVSARFHHSLAAFALGTPAITFPSNTPKLNAVSQMLALDPPLRYDETDFPAQVTRSIERVLTGSWPVVTTSKREEMVRLAENNFIGL